MVIFLVQVHNSAMDNKMRSSICFKGEVQESLSRGVIPGAKPLFTKKKKKKSERELANR